MSSNKGSGNLSGVPAAKYFGHRFFTKLSTFSHFRAEYYAFSSFSLLILIWDPKLSDPKTGIPALKLVFGHPCLCSCTKSKYKEYDLKATKKPYGLGIDWSELEKKRILQNAYLTQYVDTN